MEQTTDTSDAVIGCVAILVLLVAAIAIGWWLFGGSDEAEEDLASESVTTAKEAQAATASEETTPEPSAERSSQSPQPEPAAGAERNPPSEPRTDVEVIRAAVRKAGADPSEFRRIAVEPQGGCYVITTRRQEEQTWTNDIDYIERTMGDVYTNLYSNRRLRNTLCRVTVNSFGELVDPGGNVSNEVIYSTTMTGQQAQRVNWQNSISVDFPRVWRLNKMHPAVEQQKAEDRVERELDCMEDEGIFDFDMGC